MGSRLGAKRVVLAGGVFLLGVGAITSACGLPGPAPQRPIASMILLRERGMTSAALGVDADNPLGALGLYEAAGFEVHERFNAWRKPMDEGAS